VKRSTVRDGLFLPVAAAALLHACAGTGSEGHSAGTGGTNARPVGSGGRSATGGGTATGGVGTGGRSATGGAAPTGGSGTGGAMATADAGTNPDSGVGAKRCPAGPFPAPAMLSSTNVCTDFAFAYDSNEGPTWIASQQAFFFSNYAIQQASGGDIIKYTPGGACETFISGVGCNGLAVDNDGNLLAACQQSRSVVKFDINTKQMTTVVDNYMGQLFDSPNDLVVHSNGTIYFTNPTYELGGRPPGFGLATFRIDPTGALSLIAQGQCNGIALSPDETKLYVLFAGVWSLDPQGVPIGPPDPPLNGDGMAVDCAGNLYVSGRIYSPTRQNLGSFSGGTNLAFGGPDGTTVLVVGRGTAVQELKMNVPGLP